MTPYPFWVAKYHDLMMELEPHITVP